MGDAAEKLAALVELPRMGRVPSRALGRLVSAAEPRERPSEREAEWCLAELGGRLSELTATVADASLTLAFGLVREAQAKGEPAAWLSCSAASFYPPDAAESGVDLDTLVVAMAPDARAVARAADQLVRSGAFALVVLDVGMCETLPTPLLARLLGLAQKHETAVLFLTQPPAALGSLISLRAQATRQRRAENEFVCTLRVVKDKRRAPGWTYEEIYRGPPGLR